MLRISSDGIDPHTSIYDEFRVLTSLNYRETNLKRKAL